MNESELLERLSQDIFTYLLEGRLTTDAVAEVIRPDELDSRFDDFERLANLHFVLTGEVEAFVEDLDYRLRNIRTATKQHSNISRGAIEGHIDWPGTYQYRYSTEPGNTAVYVTDTREEQYDIPENIVLKALVETISDGLSDLAELLDDERDWVMQRWTGDTEAVEAFQRTAERNIHLQEMRDVNPHEPTERMLTTAANARDTLYREAAELVEFHQALQQGHPETMRELLADTMVTPDDEDTIFELFVLFTLIQALEGLESYGTPTLHSLVTDRDAFAEFDGPCDLRVFYNQSGDQQGVSFLPKPETSDVAAASRGDAVKLAAADVADAFFTEKSFESHTKRPDVLVVPTDHPSDGSLPYLIVEVKNSTKPGTIREGIHELLEYLAFMRRDGFVFPGEEKFGPSLNGLLVVQDFGPDEPAVQPVFEQDLPISIAQATELDTYLRNHLPALFDSSR